MLALRSTVDKLKKEYNDLVTHYNACVRALERARAQRDRFEMLWHRANDELAERPRTKVVTNKQFTPEQLRAIRRAFHPDRNPGSAEANTITQICNQALK